MDRPFRNFERKPISNNISLKLVILISEDKKKPPCAARDAVRPGHEEDTYAPRLGEAQQSMK